MGGLVSEVGSLFGGGNNNSQATAQGNVTQIKNPITDDQINAATGAVNNATGAVNNATGAATNATALQQALAGQLQGGVGQGTAAQSQLGQALAQQAAGGGPNPAQAALNSSTGTNVANQAALAAGVRGANSNPGLIARQAAQQGAATQQQAVGQAATLQAQQTLAAQQQQAALAAQQVGQGTAAANSAVTGTQGEQGNLINQQGSLINEQSALIGGVNSQNAANEALQANQNTTNLGLASTNANNAAGATGGLLNSLGGSLTQGATGGGGGAGGGLTSALAKGGRVTKDPMKSNSPMVKLPDHLKAVHGIYHMDVGGPVPQLSSPDPGFQAPANNSPLKGEDLGSQSSSSGGGKSGSGGSGGSSSGGGGISSVLPLLAMALKDGGEVPGKAKVKGDSPKNDTVPIMASAGEIVIPRSVAQSDDPVGGAAHFVAALLAKEGMGGSDFHAALKDAIKNRKKKVA